YEGTKPDVILRLEQEEAPWIGEAACPGCHCWVAVPFYIPTSNAQGFQFLHNLAIHHLL
ncbi:ZNF793 isoform 10, partial [Pan troglodytes]